MYLKRKWIDIIDDFSVNNRGIIATVLFTFFLFCLTFDAGIGHKIEGEKDLTIITGTIEKAIIDNDEGDKWLDITLKESPDFVFRMGNKEFEVADIDKFSGEIRNGHLIAFKISTYDYETKIVKTKQLRFSQRILRYGIITPFMISSDGKQYLQEPRKGVDAKTYWITLKWLVFCCVLFLGIYAFLEYTNVCSKLKSWHDKIQSGH